VETLIFMLPFMVAVGLVFLGMLVWAVRSHQYEDLEGEKHRIFFESDSPPQQRP